MIKTFADRHARELYATGKSRRFSPDIAKRVVRKLEYIDLATCLDDLRVPPGNRLHEPERDRKGHYSIAVLPGAYTVDVFSPRWGASLSVLGQSITVENDVGYEVVLPDAEPERAP